MPGSGNQGGFRAAGTGDDKKFVVLYTSGEGRDWPDHLDLNTGQFAYFGDNKTPGVEDDDSAALSELPSRVHGARCSGHSESLDLSELCLCGRQVLAIARLRARAMTTLGLRRDLNAVAHEKNRP